MWAFLQAAGVQAFSVSGSHHGWFCGVFPQEAGTGHTEDISTKLSVICKLLQYLYSSNTFAAAVLLRSIFFS